jgi:hypothetical protein
MFGLAKRKEVVHTVPLSWVERATRENPFTPDIQSLERYVDCLVFLYNEAMEGFRANASVLYGSQSIVPAYTLDSNLSLWNKNLGKAGFPIALSGIKKCSSSNLSSTKELHKQSPWKLDDVTPGRIKGELHLVTPVSIKRLDEYVLNGVQFERKRVRVLVPNLLTKPDGSKVQSVHVVRAFFYQGIRDYWYDQLDCGVRYSIIPTSSSHEFKYLKTYYDYKQNSRAA